MNKYKILKVKNHNKITEQRNINSENIDEMSIKQILSLINNEDKYIIIAIKKVLPLIEKIIIDVINTIRNKGRVFYIGSGTSGRLGVIDAAECPPTFSLEKETIQGIIAGGYQAMFQSIEGAEDNYKDGYNIISSYKIKSNDIVIGISASGNTPFVIGAIEASNTIGCITSLITNNLVENIKINHIIPLITGPEIITGSTRMKAGTATKMVLNMITTTSMIKLNKTYGNYMVDLNASNNKLWDRGARIISDITGLVHNDSLTSLKRAKGKVKVAILMILKECSYNDAEHYLEESRGSLKKAMKI